MSNPEPVVFCILGGTGDLSRRKLLPALCRLAEEGHLHPRTQVLGTGRGELSDEGFREGVGAALAQTDIPAEAIAAFCEDRVCYQALGDGGVEEFQALSERIESLERAHELPRNRVFYLALPPEAFPTMIEGLGGAGLNQSRGWTRLVVEKPFGRDLTFRSRALTPNPGRPSPAATPQPDRSTRLHNAEKQLPTQSVTSEDFFQHRQILWIGTDDLI